MTGSLIAADDFFGIAAVLLGVAAFAFWADTKKWGRSVSGVVIAILLAMAFSNLRVIPTSAPIYGDVFTYIIPFAIPLLLFKANLRRIIRESGRMLIIFGVAVIGTILGVVLGLLFMDFGAHTPAFAGMFAATYIGGSLNFYSVEAAMPLNDASLLSASVAADALIGTVFIVAIVAAPSVPLIRKLIPSPVMDAAEAPNESAGGLKVGGPINLVHISFAMALSLAICAVSFAIANALGASQYAILLVTALALATANFFPKAMKALTGDMEIGMLAIYIFLAVIGASSDLTAMVASALPLAIFAMIIITVHIIFVLFIGKLMKFDLAEIVVASNACGGGVATAAPLAAGRGWHDLVTPAILCGTLGNAIATFIGVALAQLYL